jgi:hypothetical protein
MFEADFGKCRVLAKMGRQAEANQVLTKLIEQPEERLASIASLLDASFCEDPETSEFSGPIRNAAAKIDSIESRLYKLRAASWKASKRLDLAKKDEEKSSEFAALSNTADISASLPADYTGADASVTCLFSKQDIAAGEEISFDNISTRVVEAKSAGEASPDALSEVVGAAARRRIKGGQIIRYQDITSRSDMH